MKQIAQRDIPLAVQTAGHHRAVAENGNLLAQSVAELYVGFRRLRIGPVKLLGML